MGRVKARALFAGLGAATALALSGCSSTPAQAAEVCVDPVTNIRVDDSQCEHPLIPGAYIWWYIGSGYTVPAYGWQVAYGYAYPPRHSIVVHHVQSSGGVYPKSGRVFNRNAPRTIQPTSAATQAPPVKSQSKPVQQQKPVTQTKSQPQQQKRNTWNTYPKSNPKPPSHTQYKSSTTTRTTTRYR